MNTGPLSPQQLDRIERYITAYNAIDHQLREILGADNGTPFSQLVRDYAARYPRWTEQDELRMLGDLRNTLVHQRERSYEYLSVPVPAAVATIEHIRDQLLAPERVYPRHAREVRTFQAADTLARVLRAINATGYSQFPIYERGVYTGLLTENGITRWLARHSVTVMTLVELEEVPVLDVLGQEEQRRNDLFIPRDATIIDAENHFVKNPLLEALLITANGKPAETLLGIITRWDVLAL